MGKLGNELNTLNPWYGAFQSFEFSVAMAGREGLVEHRGLDQVKDQGSFIQLYWRY